MAAIMTKPAPKFNRVATNSVAKTGLVVLNPLP